MVIGLRGIAAETDFVFMDREHSKFVGKQPEPPSWAAFYGQILRRDGEGSNLTYNLLVHPMDLFIAKLGLFIVQ